MRLHINHKEDKIFQPLAKEILNRNIGKSTVERSAERDLGDVKEDTQLCRNKSVLKVESTHASRVFDRRSSKWDKTLEAYDCRNVKPTNVPVYNNAADKKKNKVQFVTQLYSKAAESTNSRNVESRQYKSFYNEPKRSHHMTKNKARSVSNIKIFQPETASKQSENRPQDRSFHSKPTKLAPLSLKPFPTSRLDAYSPSIPQKAKQDIDAKLAAFMNSLKKPTIKRIKSERTCSQDPTKAFRDEVDFLLKYVYQCDESTKSMISSYMLSKDLKE